jgi:uroporphyrinogen decarboxylase
MMDRILVVGYGIVCDMPQDRLGYFGWPSVVRQADWPVVMHTDGDVRPLIDDLIRIGLNALHPIEPKAMDIFDLKRKYHDELCLIGNLDLAGSLGRGTPQEVRKDVEERIKRLAPGGGYAVGSSNSVAHYVPIENYKATIEFGQYPFHI